MCTYKTICVTNRHLAVRPFLEQMKQVLRKAPDAVILREKDLSGAEYAALLGQLAPLCAGTKTKLIAHSFWQEAAAQKMDALHMPLAAFLRMSEAEKRRFSVRGVSVHSVEDALLAQKNGATYLTAGHIFATDCKKDLPPRGLFFLHEVCRAVDIPVYAIGGICQENAPFCIREGAAGVCVMSGFMKLQ